MCNCNLKLKEGHNQIYTSAFLSQPIHLGKISEAEYLFYADFFPFAFEKDCKCTNTKKVNDKSKSK